MNEANRLKLGGFLLISIALLVIGFISVGVGKLFEPRYRAMTVLNTSVEGLAVGSPVKYLGLPVGKITAMTMRQKDGYIAVYFDIFPSAVEQDDDLAGDHAPGGTNFATVMRKKNMSCFINAAGIMGGAYLELSVSDSLPPAMPHPRRPARATASSTSRRVRRTSAMRSRTSAACWTNSRKSTSSSSPTS